MQKRKLCVTCSGGDQAPLNYRMLDGLALYRPEFTLDITIKEQDEQRCEQDALQGGGMNGYGYPQYRMGLWARTFGVLAFAVVLLAALLARTDAQTEQVVEVTIKDFTFFTRQVALIPGIPIMIVIRNEDAVRHDFGSYMFQGSLTQVDTEGVISYGRGLEGVFLDPERAALIRFTADRPGRYEFRCSIHPTMKGEILLLNIGSV